MNKQAQDTSGDEKREFFEGLPETSTTDKGLVDVGVPFGDLTHGTPVETTDSFVGDDYDGVSRDDPAPDDETVPEDGSMGAQIAREAGAAEQRVRDLREQRASIGARITSEAKAAQQRIAELRERRTAINAEIKVALDEYGRLRRAAKLWED